MNCFANLRRRSLDYMQDTGLFSVDAINHARLPERSRVAWLAAARGIKGRAIKRNRYRDVVPLVYAGDASIEFEQV